MKTSKLFWDLTFSVFVVLFSEVSGCWSGTPDQPLAFNVTGSLTTEAEPNSAIYLFVVDDTSFETALDTVAIHPYVIRESLFGGAYFRFVALSPGDYVAMVTRDSFPENIQGFPMVREFNRSNYSVKLNFLGGNWKYSLVSFSIRPSLEGVKTEK